MSSTSPTPTESVECLNDALATGVRADFVMSSTDARLFEHSEYWFTVDGHVTVVDWYPAPSDRGASESYVKSEGTCAGPFRIVESQCPFDSTVTLASVALDGCP